MLNNVIVVKIGTNALMNDAKEVDKSLIVLLAKQISDLMKKYDKKVVLVSSGALGFGKESMKNKLEKKLSAKEEKQIYASIGQPILVHEYQKAFEIFGLKVSQLLLTRGDFADRDKYLSMRNVLIGLLENGVVPIINENDVVSHLAIKFSDNDQLGSYVSGMLGAEIYVLMSNIDGLYDKYPCNPDAKKIEIVNDIDKDILSCADDERSEHGTGGMMSKLDAAKIVMNLGIKMYIVNAKDETVLLKIVKGEKVGTLFEPLVKKNIKGIRRWLSSGALPKGKIVVCVSIADLLRNKKRASILATGVENVSGDFTKGDVVEVFDDENNSLGYGIIKFDSSELLEVLKSDRDLKDIIVVHTDYFLSK